MVHDYVSIGLMIVENCQEVTNNHMDRGYPSSRVQTPSKLRSILVNQTVTVPRITNGLRRCAVRRCFLRLTSCRARSLDPLGCFEAFLDDCKQVASVVPTKLRLRRLWGDCTSITREAESYLYEQWMRYQVQVELGKAISKTPRCCHRRDASWVLPVG